MLSCNERNEHGEFMRQEDQFQDWVTRDGSSGYPAEPDRYHLYVSLACPWAHRTIIIRKLKRLEDIIGMTVVDPIRDDRGWAFRSGSGHSEDPINGFQFLSEAYKATYPNYDERVTVPVLWDKKLGKIVSNADEDIMRMFNSEFNDFTDNDLDFYPEELRAEIDAVNDLIYPNVNDGVYRAGFATTQQAYERAVRNLFDVLDQLEERLKNHRYLVGNQLTEADWRLFPTLIRFDAVYHGHFKCNIRRIIDYSNLYSYLRDLYQHDGIAETVNFDHIKRHYYITHTDINPTQIVPVGPYLDLISPHGRDAIPKNVGFHGQNFPGHGGGGFGYPEYKSYLAEHGFEHKVSREGSRQVALDQTGLRDNTIIIFTADHGETLGTHGGLTDKGWHHFEEIQRIPFIVWMPERFYRNDMKPGTVLNEWVSLLDVYPTILDFAGAEWSSNTVHGWSLKPLLKGEAMEWRDEIFVEFNGVNSLATSMVSVRVGDLKYGWNCSNWDELYDLSNDPFEMHNLIDEPAYAKQAQQMRELIGEWMEETNYPGRGMYRQRCRGFSQCHEATCPKGGINDNRKTISVERSLKRTRLKLERGNHHDESEDKTTEHPIFAHT